MLKLKEVSSTDKGIKTSQVVMFVMPVLGVSFLMGPLVILQGIYTKYFGLSLSELASLILVVRLFDAVTDPLVGTLSDLHYSSDRGRKNFVLAGGLLFCFSSYFLFVPIEFNTPNTLIAETPTQYEVSPIYFLVCSVMFYLAWTLFEVPHLAWGGELSENTYEKNKVYSLRALSATLGSLLFFGMPLLPFFETSEFTPETLRWAVIVANIVMLPMLFFCVQATPVGRHFQSKSVCDSRFSKTHELKKLALSIMQNRLFLIFLLAFLFTGIGVGMWFGLLFIFVDIYLGVGEKLPIVYLISMVASMPALGLWYQIANKLGKKNAWAMGMMVTISGMIGSGYLRPEGEWSSLLLCMVAIQTGFVASVALAPSLLSEIVDYGTWQNGTDCGGSYFSVYSLMIKTNAAIGGAAGLAIAGYFGFDAMRSSQTHDAVYGLHLGIARLSPMLMMLAVIFILLIPINSRRHGIISRRLGHEKSCP